jgi:hypothetical protein
VHGNLNTSYFEFSMDNSTAIPPLQGELLFVNQLELVTLTTVAGTLYGIAFTLFCLYVRLLAPQLRGGNRKRQAKFMLSYSTVIMLCGLYGVVYCAWFAQDAYIKHNNYPGGPYFYIRSTYNTNPQTIVVFTIQTTIDALTLAIQVLSYFSPIHCTMWLNSDRDLACMGHLECHSICQLGRCAAPTVFLDSHG